VKTGSFFDLIIREVTLDNLFERFICEKKYTNNVAHNTIIKYKRRGKKIISYKPHLSGEIRIYTLLCLLCGTG
jgi:hypothetical protein